MKSSTLQCGLIFDTNVTVVYSRTQVDYFSLDVEGVELEVLKTIPFDKVDIRVMTVEFSHGTLGKEVLRNFVESKGYKTVTEVTHPGNLANDFVFVKS